VLALARAASWQVLIEKPDEIKNRSLDLDYIREWLAQFDRSLGEGYVRTFEEVLKSSQ
jgi:hypothetical protein